METKFPMDIMNAAAITLCLVARLARGLLFVSFSLLLLIRVAKWQWVRSGASLLGQFWNFLPV